MTETPVVVIGLDAMDVEIARGLITEGQMPNLAAFVGSAAWSETENPPGLFVGGVWPTLTTGCGPSRHGFYCDLQIANGTYEARRCDPTHIRIPHVWDTLSEAGRRCAVLDVPVTAPSQRANVVQLVEWGAHDRFVPLCSTPDTLVVDAVREFGEYPVQPKCDDYARRGDAAGLLNALQRGITAKERLASSYLEREPWDLLWVAFGEAHCAGHQFWALHDPAHPAHDPVVRKELGDPLLRVYEQLDVALGRLLHQIPTSTTVFVLLSHGMGPHYDGDHLVSEILRRLDIADDGRRRFITWRERARRRLARRDREARRAKPLSGERRFFKVPNNERYAGIRVNLQGREPRGRVAPGADYDAVLAGLRADLLALENPDTGAPLVRDVLCADDFYDGPMRDSLPDLLVNWNCDTPITGARSAKVGTIRGSTYATRTGDHRPTGLLAVRGPSTVPGRFTPPVNATDVAPTIAAMLGVELTGVDGRPIDALVGPRARA